MLARRALRRRLVAALVDRGSTAEMITVCHLSTSRSERIVWLLQELGLAEDAFTAADIMMSFPLTTMRRYLPVDVEPHAHIRDWLARIEARPAYKKAMAIAGADASAPAA